MKNYLGLDPARLTGATLSLAAATHSFLLFSFFPYAGYMAVALLNNDNDINNGNSITVNSVGVYAGMLGAAFTFGRFLGFVPWKVCRKALGEKHALVLSFLLTGCASLWVGLSTTFSGALLARLVQGMSNCISGSVKRAAMNARHNFVESERSLVESERSHQSSDSKPSQEVYNHINSLQTLVLSVMWWGTALGPIVGGLLSDPGFLGAFLGLDPESSHWYKSHPFVLSNGFSAALCWLSMICVAVFTKDPPRTSGSTQGGENRPLLAPSNTQTGSIVNTEPRRLWETSCTLWNTNKDARNHLIAYWSFSFVAVCCDEALPLFLITSDASTGLGLSEGQVGLLLSSTGLIVAMSHHAALDNVFDTENGTKDGMYRVLRACAFLGSVPIVLVPISVLLDGYDGDGSSSSSTRSMLLGLTKSSFLYLVVLFAFLRGSARIYFSLIGMATGRTLRVVQKDEAARIMTMGALLIRSLAPIVAGGIVSYDMGKSPTGLNESLALYYSWKVWMVIGLGFGLATTLRTVSLGKQLEGEGITEKQQKYITNRLNRQNSFGSLAGVLEDAYGSASKSVCSKWNDCISFVRMARQDAKRRSTIARTSGVWEAATMEEMTNRSQHTWKEHTVAPGVDFESISFFVIGTHKKDVHCVPHVLSPSIMNAFQKHLPTSCSESNFWLKYSLLRDGATMHAMDAKSGLTRNSILAIETLNGDVFGCFMTKPWTPSNNHYRRSGESFLWRLKKRRTSTTTAEQDEEIPALEEKSDNDSLIDVYSWTGKNDLCQLFADDKIACGGGLVGIRGDGFGILLNEDLLSGSSSPCETYGNPCLCSDEHRFEVVNIEIWGLVPFMFVADAERSEQSLHFMKDNSGSTFGEEGESPSSTSAWSNFL